MCQYMGVSLRVVLVFGLCVCICVSGCFSVIGCVGA